MNPSIEQQAVNWLEKIDEAGGQLSEEQQARFEEWLNSGYDNQKIYHNLRSLYQSDELTHVLSELRKREAKIPSSSSYGERESYLRWAGFFAWSVSSLAVILFIGLIVIPLQNSNQLEGETSIVSAPNVGVKEYTTQIGERKKILANDGSRIDLNSNSEFVLELDRANRRTELKSGEAYFSVARDIERPFTVSTQFGKIRVLGTIFNVDVQSNKMVVTVKEGHVQIVKDRAVDLYENQKVSITEYAIGFVEPVAADQTNGAWRSGWTNVDGEPVITLVDRLQRYLEKPVVFSNNNDKTIVISGRYNLDNPIETLRLIAELSQLELVESKEAFVFQ